MAAYYNEFDPFAAAWLRELIKADLIAPGDVDERSIVDVRPEDLKGYTQCHFFAGIGGWSHALRLAMWPDDRPVWTGSPPCQPYSSAGKKTRQYDERHLWPHWSGLISESKPTAIFAEQVDDAITAGWLDDAFYDLENKGYACAAAVLPACSVLAPHERQRIFFCAYTECYDVQGRKVEAAEDKGSCGPEVQQLAGLLQPHAWPTLSDSKSWASNYGVSRDVGIAKANKCIGNAIVPQVAAEFIKATM